MKCFVVVLALSVVLAEASVCYCRKTQHGSGKAVGLFSFASAAKDLGDGSSLYWCIMWDREDGHLVMLLERRSHVVKFLERCYYARAADIMQ